MRVLDMGELIYLKKKAMNSSANLRLPFYIVKTSLPLVIGSNSCTRKRVDLTRKQTENTLVKPDATLTFTVPFLRNKHKKSKPAWYLVSYAYTRAVFLCVVCKPHWQQE